ncbi:single-pass membrane and coiled-coil domain-containing protein 3-like [Carettochelys insculpta]|uniref:single-pass membrane and coiled-coil domain-containing protein 3-like n=1 Tax=Carettochelys insculpta TaxID=44489 RepID=UPI003EBE9E09
MSWSDILYPDNPARREKVVRLHQELLNSMELNFDATNELIGMLNKHWHCGLCPIKMKTSDTIQENCDLLLAAMTSIQGELKAIDEKLRSCLEPDLYRKLHDFQEMDQSKMKILRTATQVARGAIGITAAAIIIKVGLSALASRVLSNVMMIVARVGIILGGIVVSAILGVGIDLIISAILGAKERKDLEEKIRELQEIVDEFKPASKEYSKAIMKVMLLLE